LLLVLLNIPVVKKQIRAKQFTQDIIDTLGKRILVLVLPVPKSPKSKDDISQSVKTIIEQRSELRNQARQIVIDIIDKKTITEEEKEILEQL
jgi:type I restriction enzyme M protein